MKKKSPLIFYIYYFVIFLALSIQGSFLSLYLNGAGLSSQLIGFINGLIQVITLLILPIYGRIADRASSKNKVLLIGIAMVVFMMVLFSMAKSVLTLCIMMVLFSVMNNPLASVYETITMEFVSKNGYQYSPIRMSGTISFSIMALIAGFVLSKNEKLIFPLYIAMMAITFIVACMLPKIKGTPKQKQENKGGASVYSLLKMRKFRNVLLLLLVFSMGTAFNSTYYGIYMTQMGGSYAYVGVANMLLGLSEIPFHVGRGRKWLQKIGIERSMLLVMAVGTVRWIIAGVCHNPIVLVLTMGFNGVMLVPTIVGMVEFLYDNAPEGLKVSAQTSLKTSFQFGGQLIANIVGGALVGMLDAMGVPGIRTVFLILSPVFMIAGILVYFSIRKGEREEIAQG